MAVVFLISYCRVWVMSGVSSTLVKRRLASAGEEGVEEAKEKKYQQVCGTPQKGMDAEEEISTGGLSRQPPTFEVLGGGSLIEGDYSRKRKSDHEHGGEHDVAPKAVRLTDGEVVWKGTSGTSLTRKSTSSSLSLADVEGGEKKAMQKLDSSQRFDLNKGSSEAGTTPSYYEGRKDSEVESSEFWHKMTQSTLDEALMGENTSTLVSSALNSDAMPRTSSPLLSDDLILELVEQLEPYIDEALKAEDDSLVELWMLEPDAPVPPSPTSEAPLDEEEKESPQGSFVTQEEHEGEAARPSTSDAPAGAKQTPPPSLHLGWREYADHPFYHLPTIPAPVLHQLTTMYAYRMHYAAYDFYGLLNAAQRLLAKQSLDLLEAKELFGCANALIGHASSRLRNPLTGVSSFHFAHALALRFLISDILWCACELLGQILKKDRWWQPLMESMLAIEDTWSLEKFKRQRDARKKVELVQAILRIVNIYKAGQRPSPRDVVRIKQLIFCGDDQLIVFQQKLWNPWRQADICFRAELRKK
ncbi:hypothetical protein Emag_007072 [Eimeria magna]